MKYANIFIYGLLASLIVIGCEDNKADEDDTPIVDDSYVFNNTYSGKIGDEAQLFSFADSAYATSYDLEFIYANSEYNIKLNAAANVLAIRSDSTFDIAELPLFGYGTDSTELVIGNHWQDESTYNFGDNHSILSNGSVYFVRTTTYQWIKIEILYASTIKIKFKYDIVDDVTDVKIDSLSWSNNIPVYYNFSQAITLDPEPWDIGFLTVPIYSEELNQSMATPAVILNFDLDIQIGIITDQTVGFEDFTDVPTVAEWITDSAIDRSFGYEGDNEILVYHPEPPYNHKVIVENPDYGYVVKTGDDYYMLQFNDYALELVIFQYFKF